LIVLQHLVCRLFLPGGDDMKSITSVLFVAVFLFTAGLSACSDPKEITDKAAKEAVQRIRTPLDKANAVKGMEEGRAEEIDQAASEP
jgi:DNA polymerase III delta prime subunit